ncbi:hypothetical protein LTR62_000738 [Meristemomyces frigidus]|uniref:Uncharacterized protein n=1 Tax=Meristemomyces frigidus TaxID=1508187 RepID=A0AAN7T9X4_9PEZI|nr:hypothetical protein LTR62_000738 [Meristemomyces frigidus]
MELGEENWRQWWEKSQKQQWVEGMSVIDDFFSAADAADFDVTPGDHAATSNDDIIKGDDFPTSVHDMDLAHSVTEMANMDKFRESGAPLAPSAVLGPITRVNQPDASTTCLTNGRFTNGRFSGISALSGSISATLDSLSTAFRPAPGSLPRSQQPAAMWKSMEDNIPAAVAELAGQEIQPENGGRVVKDATIQTPVQQEEKALGINGVVIPWPPTTCDGFVHISKPERLDGPSLLGSEGRTNQGIDIATVNSVQCQDEATNTLMNNGSDAPDTTSEILPPQKMKRAGDGSPLNLVPEVDVKPKKRKYVRETMDPRHNEGESRVNDARDAPDMSRELPLSLKMRRATEDFPMESVPEVEDKPKKRRYVRKVPATLEREGEVEIVKGRKPAEHSSFESATEAELKPEKRKYVRKTIAMPEDEIETPIAKGRKPAKRATRSTKANKTEVGTRQQQQDPDNDHLTTPGPRQDLPLTASESQPQAMDEYSLPPTTTIKSSKAKISRYSSKGKNDMKQVLKDVEKLMGGPPKLGVKTRGQIKEAAVEEQKRAVAAQSEQSEVVPAAKKRRGRKSR